MKLLEKKIVKKLIQKKLQISIVESCTGGLLSSTITSISGSSKVFNLGLITYSNLSKSQKVCFYMVKNMNKIDKAKLSVSITGIAGPDGGSKNKPVGLVYIGLMKNNKIKINRYLFKNRGRTYIQKAAVNKCLKLILSFLK